VIARAHWASLTAVVVAGCLAGCGSTTVFGSTTARHAQEAPARSVPLPPLPQDPAGDSVVPTPGPTGIAARPAAVAVIKAWSDALRRGDVSGAARYFSLPSVMINGTDAAGDAVVITIGTVTQAEQANESLPCGALLLSTDQRGRYVNALFRLTGRPGPGGSDCGTGAGQTARTNFVITDGRIIEWIRAPDDPGDNHTPTTPSPTTPSPTTPSPTTPSPTTPSPTTPSPTPAPPNPSPTVPQGPGSNV
jgi:cell division septation protein DedD